MRKRMILTSVLLLLSLFALPAVAVLTCQEGQAIRSPIDGALIDCLEGGSGCLVCTEEIEVRK